MSLFREEQDEALRARLRGAYMAGMCHRRIQTPEGEKLPTDAHDLIIEYYDDLSVAERAKAYGEFSQLLEASIDKK